MWRIMQLAVFICALMLTEYARAAPVICFPDKEEDIVDLTWDYVQNSAAFPAFANSIRRTIHAGPVADWKFWVEKYELFGPEHSGTHMDASVHLRTKEGGLYIDEFQFDSFLGPGVRLDIAEKGRQNPDAVLTVKDIEDHEAKYGEIPKKAVIMVYTGWGKYITDRAKYVGQDFLSDYRNSTWSDANGKSLMHFPGVSGEAATWLVKNRQPLGVGIDATSIDVGQSDTFPTHLVLSDNDIWIMENVGYLEKLPPRGMNIYVFPMKIAKGTGAPTRIIAVRGCDIA